MGKTLKILVVLVAFIVVGCIAHSAKADGLSSVGKTWAVKALRAADKQDWKEAFYAAEQSGSPLFKKIIKWTYYTRKGNSASYSEIYKFIQDNPKWPMMEQLETRAEEAMNKSYSLSEAYKWFSKHPPQTGNGKLFYAMAMLEKSESYEGAVRLLKEGWVESNISGEDFEDFSARYGKYIDQKDYIQKIDRLLWDRETRRAESIMSRVPASYQQLFRARIAVIDNSKNAETLINQVSKELQNDAGLLYDRIKYRAERGQEAGVRELLARMSGKMQYPERLFSIRQEVIIDLIRAKNYKMAYEIQRRHGLEQGEKFALAEWQSGWLALRYLKNPRVAYEHFYKLYQGVKYPVSQSRAAYWAGLAAKAAGNKDIAANWFKIAASHPTTFYGQLALDETGGKISLPKYPKPSTAKFQEFKQTELAKAALMLGSIGYESVAKHFLYEIGNHSKDPEIHEMTAMLGDELGMKSLTVKSAKNSLKNNIILVRSGYPILPYKGVEGIENALTHAITRQESEFDPDAESSAGALGLMQLLPSTARNMAKQVGMPFNESSLTDGKYNLKLGTAYIKHLIDNYDGSYVMAIAAYNAGPGRVRQWVQDYGDPRKGQVSEIDWMESIPFSETRNYVQRVLENLEIYRHLGV